MKKFKIFNVILTFILFLCSFTACKSNTYELNLMSFNIKIPGGSGVQTWGSRREAVFNHINTSGADIIGLQEVSSTPYSDLLINLASNYELVYFQDPENLAIIYDKTVFKLVSKEKYWLSETPDVRSYGWGEATRRMAAVLILEHIETGEKVKAINTHGPLNDTANEKAFELIAERSLSGDSDTFTFLCGDFNAEPGKLGYVPIADKLQDCRVTAAKSSTREQGTFHDWGSVSRPVIIDYCFVSKSEKVKVLTYEVRQDKWGNGNYISDHYAVQVAVKIEKDKNNS